MTTPPLGKNDLLLLSNGPGNFVTVEAMAKLAEEKGKDATALGISSPDCKQSIGQPVRSLVHDVGCFRL